MTFVQLRAYGTYGTPVHVVCERILSLHEIDYNGNYGVEITMDNGHIVRVRGYLHDIQKTIDAATTRRVSA